MSEKALSPFDIVGNINSKGGILSDEDLVGYNPWLTNVILSNTQDSIFFANEMNYYWNIPKEAQYRFFYYGLSKKKRYGKYNKNADPMADIKVIQEYYGYSYAKAKEVLSLLQPKLEEIRLILYKGGKK
jgi:hypothetical protein